MAKTTIRNDCHMSFTNCGASFDYSDYAELELDEFPSENVKISKVADQTTVYSGSVVKFTVSISFTGEAYGEDVIFTDTIPDTMELIAESVTLPDATVVGNTITASLGDVESGTSITFSYKCTVL